MYYIEKGEVDVLSRNKLTVVVKLKAGQYFGERNLLLGEPRAATLRFILLFLLFFIVVHQACWYIGNDG